MKFRTDLFSGLGNPFPRRINYSIWLRPPLAIILLGRGGLCHFGPVDIAIYLIFNGLPRVLELEGFNIYNK